MGRGYPCADRVGVCVGANSRERAQVMTIERVSHTGALVVTALVNWDGVKWYESATYYGYTAQEARASFKETCARLNYKIERG